MKREHFIFVCLIGSSIVLLLIGCQQQNQPVQKGMTTSEKPLEQAGMEPKPVVASPKITFEKTVCDFGEVGPNVENKAEIKFTNKGDASLKIIKIPSCCGVHTSLEKMEYAPGESGVIGVQWTSGSRPMNFIRTMVVHSNDTTHPAVTLTVKAKVVQRVVCEPEKLQLVFDEENAGCPEITVRSLNNEPFSITGFRSTADCITADFDPSVEATKFVLQPKVNTEKLQKNLKGRITIGLAHTEGSTVTILFDVLARYELIPPMVIVFDAEPKTPTVRKISVLNNYEQDFEIESVASMGNTIGVRVLDKKKIKDGYQLDLEITPPAAGDGIKFSDKFTIHLSNGETIPISCNGYFTKRKPSVSKK